MNQISLNHDFWRFCIDPEDEGLDQEWYLQDNQPYLEDKTTICVPSCWNRKSGDELENYRGVAWYWRVFRIPDSFKGKKYYLKIARMAHKASIFIDGQEIGSFHGGYVPFKLDISSIETGMDHFLAIRIDAREEANRYIMPKIDEDDPLYGGIQEYYGLFGDVTIETEESIVLDEISLETKLFYDESGENVKYAELSFSLYLINNSSQEYKGTINIDISRDFVPVTEVSRDFNILANNSRLSKIVFNIDIEPEDVWCPENPTLYDMHLTIGNDDGVLIEMFEVIGLREIEYKNDRLYLNGKEFNGKGAIIPIGEPRFGYVLPSFIIGDMLRKLKKENVSIIRPNQGVFSPLMIEMASRMGFLVIGDVPLVKLASVERNSFYKDYINSVSLQPSLVLWSVHPILVKMAETDPGVHTTILDIEKLFNSRLAPSRFFVYKGDFGIKEWVKVPNVFQV